MKSLGTTALSSQDSAGPWQPDYLLEVVVCLIFNVLREQRLRGGGGLAGNPPDTLRDGGEARHLSGHIRREVRRGTCHCPGNICQALLMGLQTLRAKMKNPKGPS